MDYLVYAGVYKRIIFCSEKSGKNRGKEYFDGLPKSDRAKLEAIFRMLGEIGKVPHPEKFKKEADGIFCFKTYQRRMLCFMNGSDVLITHGFTKKKDRMSPQELARAKRIRDEFFERGR